MATKFFVDKMGERRNRKEIWLTLEEIQLLRFASKYYSADMTTTIRILMRTSILALIAQQKRDGIPKLSKETQELIDGLTC